MNDQEILAEIMGQKSKDAHVHSFVFLRQETKNIGYDRNPTWIVEDVFFCSSCLEYKRIAVEKRTPRSLK